LGLPFGEGGEGVFLLAYAMATPLFQGTEIKLP
jgi:hypothetical protein